MSLQLGSFTPIEGSFDRTKAALEALDNLRKDEAHNRRMAIKLLKEEATRFERRAVFQEAKWKSSLIG